MNVRRGSEIKFTHDFKCQCFDWRWLLYVYVAKRVARRDHRHHHRDCPTKNRKLYKARLYRSHSHNVWRQRHADNTYSRDLTSSSPTAPTTATIYMSESTTTDVDEKRKKHHHTFSLYTRFSFGSDAIRNEKKNYSLYLFFFFLHFKSPSCRSMKSWNVRT